MQCPSLQDWTYFMETCWTCKDWNNISTFWVANSNSKWACCSAARDINLEKREGNITWVRPCCLIDEWTPPLSSLFVPGLVNIFQYQWFCYLFSVLVNLSSCDCLSWTVYYQPGCTAKSFEPVDSQSQEEHQERSLLDYLEHHSWKPGADTGKHVTVSKFILLIINSEFVHPCWPS